MLDVRAAATLQLTVLLLLLLLLLQLGVADESLHRARRRRGHHHGQSAVSRCPAGCVCRPASEVPCDWCIETSGTAAAADSQDGRVSCEGCGGLGKRQQVRDCKRRLHSRALLTLGAAVWIDLSATLRDSSVSLTTHIQADFITILQTKQRASNIA